MNINELVHGMNGISLERGMKHQDSETSEHHERGVSLGFSSFQGISEHSLLK